MGRIVKGGAQQGALATGTALASLELARAEAEAILARARAEAARLEADARAEIEARRTAREGESRLGLERLREAMEEEVVALALAVAAKVLAVAVEDPRAVRETARRALRLAGGSERLRLRCHPEDEAALRAGALQEDGAAAPVLIVPDPAVGRGGALLETDAGAVDARIETQLGRLARGLAEPA